MELIIRAIIAIFKMIFEEDSDRRVQERQRLAKLQRARQGGRAQSPQVSPGQRMLEELFAGVPDEHKPVEVAYPKATVPPLPEYSETSSKASYANRHRLVEDAQELPLHDDSEPNRRLRLPGSTPLQQMIYAQVILGPCKAKQSNHRLL